MMTLFKSMDPVIPSIPGLTYQTEFLSREEHDQLLSVIDALPWNTQWKRRIQPYGYSYGSSTGAPMPAWGSAIAERLYVQGLAPFICDQLLVNEYLPGQGIFPHADYQTYDRTVVSISLGSPCIMDFIRNHESERHALWLEPRSVLIMDGEARYQWMHGIAARKKDQWNGTWFQRGRRVSVTLRKSKVA
jgi:alkylated DNA repair dioxygenase AlkB